MTYYTDIWKRGGRERKAKFWESDVIEKKKIVTRKTKERKDEKDAGKTVHKRSTRKVMGIRSIFFCRPEAVKIFTTFSV